MRRPKKAHEKLTERQRIAWEMREAGNSWSIIASALGTQKGAARSSYLAARDKVERAAVFDREPGTLFEDTRSKPDTYKKSLAKSLASENPEEKSQAVLKVALEEAGTPTGLSNALLKRLKAVSGVTVASPRDLSKDAATIEECDRVKSLAFAYFDDYVMSQASVKDLATVITAMTNVTQLLKGQPTAIMAVEDRRSLTQVATALAAEIGRRKEMSGIIDITPEEIEVMG